MAVICAVRCVTMKKLKGSGLVALRSGCQGRQADGKFIAERSGCDTEYRKVADFRPARCPTTLKPP
jgi:hypothetical protein